MSQFAIRELFRKGVCSVILPIVFVLSVAHIGVGEEPEFLFALAGHGGWVESTSFSPDGKRLATRCSHGTIKLWDMNTGQCIQTLEGFPSGYGYLAFSPDGELLAIGSWANTVVLMDTRTWEERAILRGHKAAVKRVAFGGDGEYIASASDDDTIKIWSVRNGNLIRTLGRFPEQGELLEV